MIQDFHILQNITHTVYFISWIISWIHHSHSPQIHIYVKRCARTLCLIMNNQYKYIPCITYYFMTNYSIYSSAWMLITQILILKRITEVHHIICEIFLGLSDERTDGIHCNIYYKYPNKRINIMYHSTKNAFYYFTKIALHWQMNLILYLPILPYSMQ